MGFYNNNRKFRSFSSSRGNSFGGPKKYYSNARFKTQSSFGQDPSIFIKKAQQDAEFSDYQTSNSFEDFPLISVLKQNILNKGFNKPTPIQDQAIMPILQGRDIIGIANTGTGKTAAFLIPIINNIFKFRDRKALIVVPTRELAVQINEDLKSLAFDMKIYSTLAIGGMNIERQIINLKKNPHVVIGTPGRIKDLIQKRKLFLDEFSIFVLDEVDLMVDIGFINDVKYFISLLPKVRQSLFFSATVSAKINDILQLFVKNPVTISVKKQDTSQNVEQDIVTVSSISKKVDQLHDLLIQDGFDKVLIFGRTKHSVEKLYRELAMRGFKAGAIHGNKSQGQRQRVLTSFKQNEIQVLLATDVASRGLDIPNVTHVINYEIPDSYDDYIHRIGRTGRASNKGTALTFIVG